MGIDFRKLLDDLQEGKLECVGSGADRNAFLSVESNVIVKCRRPVRHGRKMNQNKIEAEIFARMTDEDKEVFPIIAAVKEGNEYYIIMEPVDILNRIGYAIADSLYNAQISRLEPFIEKFKITDLHRENLGRRSNGNLCIVDAGFNLYSLNDEEFDFDGDTTKITTL